MPAVPRLSGCSLRQKLEAIEVFPLGGADRPWREVFIEHFEVDVYRLVEGQIGPVTFAEIADGLASIDVSGHDPEWREVWQIQSGGRSGRVAEGLGRAADPRPSGGHGAIP